MAWTVDILAWLIMSVVMINLIGIMIVFVRILATAIKEIKNHYSNYCHRIIFLEVGIFLFCAIMLYLARTTIR